MTAAQENKPIWSSGPTERPYADAAPGYWKAEWRGLLPLPPNAKSSPPTGWTGHGADYPSWPDVFTWMEEKPDGNIALRLPPGVLGVDVDAYGGKPGAATLAGLETEHGPLPATWTSTSRAGGVSGIRLFKVPEGINWVGALPGIETIHAGHRYLVAAPSVHPEGRTYRWVAPDGRDADRVPAPGELPALPIAWVAALARPYPRADPADLDGTEVKAWLDGLREGVQCRPVTAVLVRELTRLAARDGGARHDICRDASRALAAFGGEGHSGVREALGALAQGFLKAATDPAHAGTTRDTMDATAEWRDLLLGAVRLAAAANPTPASECDCVTDDDLYDLAGQPRPSATPGSGPAGDSPANGPENSPGSPTPARIDITDEPAAIRGIGATICAGAIPDTYVRNGQLVRIGAISGDINARPQVGIDAVNADGLRRLLAHHTDTYRMKSTKTATFEVPTSPAVATCKSVLTDTEWRGLRHLAGIVAMPVLRPDGSLLQAPGYDTATRLYYHPKFDIEPLPDRLAPALVAQARALLLDYVLVDFPFVTDADRANYIALLVTPILRPHVGGLTPFGAISATERGSGKTLLTGLLKNLFGLASRTWVSDDNELRKAITAVLAETKPVVLFDNVGEYDTISSPVLAKLLTEDQWDDRLLGTNQNLTFANDRLWLATGNAMVFGGDIPSRTVLIRLDPECPRPDLRGGFKIPDLGSWLKESDKQLALLRALLILACDWVAAGAERAQFVMRDFTRWACGVGGFLAHHSIPAFLANASELEERDDEGATWTGFLHEWFTRFGDTWRSPTELRESAEPVYSPMGGADPWRGRFLTDGRGQPVSARSLGRRLQAKRGRFFGGYRVESVYDQHAKAHRYRVTQYQPDGQA